MKHFSTQRLLVLACLLGACGQVRHGEAAGGRAGEATGGRAGEAAGGRAGEAAGGRAGAAQGGAASGGTGITLGGSISLGGAGAPAIEPTGPVPLSSTQQCGQDFVRVDQLPDTPLYFAGDLDGEPTLAQLARDDASLPYVSIFRFGAQHVEAISMGFFLPETGYTGLLHLGAGDCIPYGSLSGETAGLPPHIPFETTTFRSTTYSSDGYTGVTIGTLHGVWHDAAGEQHVLTADFVLEANMPDARVRD